MNVGSTVGFWTIGIITLTGVRKDTLLKSVKNIFSVNVYAVIAALVIAATGIPVPKVIASVSASLGGIAVPFTIVLTGAALCNGVKKLGSHKRDVVYISVVRLLIMPLILTSILKLLPLERTVYETCFVVALMPAAVTSVLVTRINGGDDLFAGQSIIVTTLLSLGTIPLLMLLL